MTRNEATSGEAAPVRLGFTAEEARVAGEWTAQGWALGTEGMKPTSDTGRGEHEVPRGWVVDGDDLRFDASGVAGGAGTLATGAYELPDADGRTVLRVDVTPRGITGRFVTLRFSATGKQAYPVTADTRGWRLNAPAGLPEDGDFREMVLGTVLLMLSGRD